MPCWAAAGAAASTSSMAIVAPSAGILLIRFSCVLSAREHGHEAKRRAIVARAETSRSTASRKLPQRSLVLNGRNGTYRIESGAGSTPMHNRESEATLTRRDWSLGSFPHPHGGPPDEPRIHCQARSRAAEEEVGPRIQSGRRIRQAGACPGSGSG